MDGLEWDERGGKKGKGLTAPETLKTCGRVAARQRPPCGDVATVQARALFTNALCSL